MTKKVQVEEGQPEDQQDKLQEAEAEAAHFRELAMRMQADFENYKKRYERERAEWKAFSDAEFIASLLPVLDSFESAMKNSQDDGLKGIYRQLLSALEAHSLKRIECVGKQFDPYRHEVLVIEKSDKDEIVLEEFQTGYMVGDAVIRHSKVKVGKATESV